MHTRTVYSRDGGQRCFLWIITAVIIVVLAAPLAFLLLASFRGPPEFLPIESGAHWTIDNFAYIYLDRLLYTKILPNTLIFAVGSLGVSCFVALALAWYFERPKNRATIWARIFILAPMALPTPALAMAWIQLLGPNAGWVNLALRQLLGSGAESGPFNIFSMAGIIWCQGIAGIPVAYLLLAPSIRAVRRDMEEAGYVAGSGPGTVLRRISLPNILPSVAGPLLILFLISLEQVDFPYFLGPTAGIAVLGTKILWEATSPSGLPNIGATAAAAMLILAVALVGLAIHDKITSRIRRDSGASSRGDIYLRWSPSWVAISMWGIIGIYAFVAFAVPLGTLMLQSLGGPGSGGASSISQCCTNGFALLAGDSRFWKAMANTLLVAILAAVTGTSIGVGIGLCSVTRGDRLGSLLNKLSISSIAIPSLLVAFGAAVMFTSIPVGIYGTVGLLVIAYSYRIALSTRMARGALAHVGTSVGEAAAVSGAGWIRTQIVVVLPLILPSVIASTAFLFVAGVKEFIIPVMLYSPDNVVLSVLLTQLQQAGNPLGAAAIGVVMTAITLLGVVGLVLADDRLVRSRSSR